MPACQRRFNFHERAQGRLRDQLPHEADLRDSRFAVIGIVQIIGIDGQRSVRVGRAVMP